VLEPRDNSERIRRDAANFERAFREEHPYQYWSTLAAPVLVSGVLLAVVAALWGGAVAQSLMLRALAAFFVFGKFAILEPTTALSSEALFSLIVYMDLMVAVFISFHMAGLFRLPLLGPRLAALVSDGEFMLAAQPWMRRMTFVGLVCFVMVPLAATGSIGGAIFGRLLGLPRRTTFFGVTLGSVLGCGVMYFGAELIRAHVSPDDPWLLGGGIALILAVLWLLNARYRRAKRRAGY